MKQSHLTHLIKKTVKEAIREELQSILTEAIIAASEPEVTQSTTQSRQQSATAKSENTNQFGTSGIGAMLEMTKQEMSQQDVENMGVGEETRGLLDPSNLVNSQTVQEGHALKEMDFIKRAKAVLDKSFEIDAKKRV